MQIYLAAAPDEAQEAARFRRPLAHPRLPDRAGLHPAAAEPAAGHPGRAAGRQRPGCAACGAGRRTWPPPLCGSAAAGSYSGVLLELPQPPGPDRLALAAALAQALAPRPLYVPESCGSVPGTVPLISTALSGGSFTRRLREAASRRRGPPGPGCGAAADGLPPPLPRAAKGGPSAAGSSGTCWTGRLRRCSSPRISAPGTSPTPGRARPTSSSSTTPTPSSRSCGPAALWASPPPFSCSRRCGTFCPACSRPGGTEAGRAENQKCCTGPVQHFFINSSASCSCERLRTSCGA